MRLQRLGIDIVSGCNLLCVGCPNSTIKRKLEFTTPEDFNTILSNIDVKHIENLKLYNFGETFLHHQLDEMLDIIKKQKWSTKHVEMSTNGQILDQDQIISVFKSLMVTRFGISADGNCTSEVYEILRPGAKWNNLIEFLGFIDKYRDDYISNSKCFLKVLCTGNKMKWKELARDFCLDIQWRKWRKAPDSVKYKDAKLKVPNHSCKHVESSRVRCYVDWNGDVVPCCNHPKAAVFGNLKEQNFSDIYHGKKRKDFINLLNKNRKRHPICGRCEVK